MFDESSFDEHYRFAAMIAGRLRRQMPQLQFRCGPDDMEQVAAVALLRLLRRYRGLNPSRWYLAAMLRHAVLEELRRERLIAKGGGPEVVPLVSDDRAVGPDHEREFFLREAVEDLYRRLASLPPSERDFAITYVSILRSRDYEREGVMETLAARLQIPENMAFRRMRAVRARLVRMRPARRMP